VTIRITVIENDPAVIDLVSANVGETQHIEVVSVATNYRDALAAIRKGGVDIALCDIDLHVDNAIDFIFQCRQLSPKVDVVVLTNFPEQSKVIRSLRAGARSFILKNEKLAEFTSAIEATVAGGSSISPSIAHHLVDFFQPPAPKANASIDKLTKKERELLIYLARGFSVQELADMLKISKNTISTHIKSIYKKLAVKSRTAAVYEATNRGLTDINVGEYGASRP
jgi:DNA-binding NarL/FixJ family response regulator